MLKRLVSLVLVSLLVTGAVLAPSALAQGMKLKIGVVYDYSGPLAGGGSDLHALGAKIMIDHFILLGFYSSAQCVPVAARIEQLKKFMFITTCISSAVLENRNFKYVFRAQPSGRQFGLMSMAQAASLATEAVLA